MLSLFIMIITKLIYIVNKGKAKTEYVKKHLHFNKWPNSNIL